MRDPDRYRRLIEHLDTFSGQIWRGDREAMDSALRAAKKLPEAIVALEAVRDYLERSSFDVTTNSNMVDAIDNVLASIEESPNAAD